MYGFQFSRLPALFWSGIKKTTAEDDTVAGAVARLRYAAELVENTAFCCAGSQPTAVISQLIMVSADLERLAQTIERHVHTDG